MAYKKLGVDSKHRRSMRANLASSLIMNERIETTQARAITARRDVEKLITLAKRGSLVSRRNVLAFLMNDTVATKKLFDEIAPSYQDRNGGYTRILKLDNRKGDDAEVVVLELVK